MYNVKCVQGFLKDASLHEGEQGKLFVETLTCLDDRLSYCKTKILLRSKFSPAQTLHRRNTQKLVKPLRLPPVFQVQGSDLLCLVYMMNNLLQMDGVIDQNSLDLIAFWCGSVVTSINLCFRLNENEKYDILSWSK